jgi:hypothetical protein
MSSMIISFCFSHSMGYVWAEVFLQRTVIEKLDGAEFYGLDFRILLYR